MKHPQHTKEESNHSATDPISLLESSAKIKKTTPKEQATADLIVCRL